MNWWWTDDELMMNWWWTDDELMMNWWWTDDEQLMNWWWTAGLVWCAKDYHRLPQTATDWLVLLHWTLKAISGGLAWIIHISLTPPTTRAPLAVLKTILRTLVQSQESIPQFSAGVQWKWRKWPCPQVMTQMKLTFCKGKLLFKKEKNIPPTPRKCDNWNGAFEEK